MFCSNCGSFVGADEAFCPMCGTAVGNAAPEAGAVNEAPVKEPAVEPAPAPAPEPAAVKPAPVPTPVPAAAPVKLTKKEKKAMESKPLRDPPGLWNNVGLKIKVLAKILAILGMIVYAVIGIGLIVAGIVAKDQSFEIALGEATFEVAIGGLSMIIAGAVIIIVGFLVCWIGSWMVYAYGDMADKLNSIEKNTRK